jgi:Mlc titration factor MtfA (ptsG expression regulator)
VERRLRADLVQALHQTMAGNQIQSVGLVVHERRHRFASLQSAGHGAGEQHRQVASEERSARAAWTQWLTAKYARLERRLERRDKVVASVRVAAA